MKKKSYMAATVVLIILLLAPFALISRRTQPLPFDQNLFQSTKLPDYASGQPLPQRLLFKAFSAYSQVFNGGRSSVSFPPSPNQRWMLYLFLTPCMQITGNRYLTPKCLEVANVQFGFTNTLKDGQFVAAAESTLQTNDVEFWDDSIKKMRHEHLHFLRFARQKVVVVLPASEVADFLRTNHIQMDKFQ